jgi:hypothetical protein
VIDSLLKEAGFTTDDNPVTSLISAAKALANGALVPQGDGEVGEKN